MQDATDFETRQRQRRRKTNADTVISVFWELVCAGALLWARERYFPPDSLPSFLLLILAVIDAALIIPIFIVRRQRLKEIAGGEEDEARNY